MLALILNLAFASTGLFTGASDCMAKSDMVSLDVVMNVKADRQLKASDSISSSLNLLITEVKKLNLKKTSIFPLAGEEGQTDKYNRDLDGEKFKFYAEKGLKVSSKDYSEVEAFLKTASKFGFLLTRKPRYEFSKLDSLNSHCIEVATIKAVDRAKSAQKALNYKTLKILKITDSPSFSFYTSDDTMDDDEQIDGFFNYESRIALAAGGAGRSHETFYSIVSQPIKATATVKILVQFE